MQDTPPIEEGTFLTLVQLHDRAMELDRLQFDWEPYRQRVLYLQELKQKLPDTDFRSVLEAESVGFVLHDLMGTQDLQIDNCAEMRQWDEAIDMRSRPGALVPSDLFQSLAMLDPLVWQGGHNDIPLLHALCAAIRVGSLFTVDYLAFVYKLRPQEALHEITFFEDDVAYTLERSETPWSILSSSDLSRNTMECITWLAETCPKVTLQVIREGSTYVEESKVMDLLAQGIYFVEPQNITYALRHCFLPVHSAMSSEVGIKTDAERVFNCLMSLHDTRLVGAGLKEITPVGGVLEVALASPSPEVEIVQAILDWDADSVHSFSNNGLNMVAFAALKDCPIGVILAVLQQDPSCIKRLKN